MNITRLTFKTQIILFRVGIHFFGTGSSVGRHRRLLLYATWGSSSFRTDWLLRVLLLDLLVISRFKTTSTTVVTLVQRALFYLIVPNSLRKRNWQNSDSSNSTNTVTLFQKRIIFRKVLELIRNLIVFEVVFLSGLLKILVVKAALKSVERWFCRSLLKHVSVRLIRIVILQIFNRIRNMLSWGSVIDMFV